MNGTNRTSRKKQSKQHRRSNRSNSQQAINGQLSKKQQAILNAPVKFGDEVLVTIHGIGSSGEGVGRVDDFTVFVPFALRYLLALSINSLLFFGLVVHYLAGLQAK